MIKETGIKDLVIIEPRVFHDDRGYFMESFNREWWQDGDTKYDWVQDNEAFSTRGVLRGLHFQSGEHAQAKLVRVIYGEVLDVVVDLRLDSPTKGKVFSQILSGENKIQLLVPRGFAHGYIVLSDEAIFTYKCDNLYDKPSERGIHPFDPNLNIDWIISKEDILLSKKDQDQPFMDKVKIL
jgi:dTDP-4-dehydrorhamnose 3,5-epimerase